MGRVAAAIWIGWLAVVWLIAALAFSIVDYVRGLDPVTLAIGLVVQAVVVIVWTFWRGMPLWIVGGHGLILVGLALGLVVTAPSGPAGEMTFGSGLPWLVVGLVPVGLAMVIAALVAWNREHIVGH